MHMMNTMAMIVFATKLSICPKALKLFVHNVGPLPYQYVFAWHSSTFGISANMLFLSIRCLFAIKQKGIEIKHSTQHRANHLVHNRNWVRSVGYHYLTKKYSNLWRLTFPLFKAFSCFRLPWIEKIQPPDFTMWHLVSLWGRFSLGFTCTLHIHNSCLLSFGTFRHSERSTSTFSNWLCTGNINMKPNIADVQTGIWFFVFQKRKNTLLTVFVLGVLLWHDSYTNSNLNWHTHTTIGFHIFCDAFGWWILHTFAPNSNNRQFHALLILFFILFLSINYSFLFAQFAFSSLLLFQFASAFSLKFCISGNMHR